PLDQCECGIYHCQQSHTAQSPRCECRLVTLAFWLAALGLWLAPAAWLPEPAFAARALGSVTLLAVIYAAFALIQRSQGYELQVDTRRRELRIGEVTPSGQAWIKASIRFDEVGDSVTRAADKARALRDLCLRVRDSGVLWPVAVGDEAAVFAVHTRLMADLRPLEERVSSYRLAAGQGAARRVFPPLVPQEIAA
nr:hypothetical protein [Rhodobacter sp.]